MTFSSVVLPAPFGPTMPSASPSATMQTDVLDRLDRAERLRDAVELDQGRQARPRQTGSQRYGIGWSFPSRLRPGTRLLLTTTISYGYFLPFRH